MCYKYDSYLAQKTVHFNQKIESKPQKKIKRQQQQIPRIFYLTIFQQQL